MKIPAEMVTDGRKEKILRKGYALTEIAPGKWIYCTYWQLNQPNF